MSFRPPLLYALARARVFVRRHPPPPPPIGPQVLSILYLYLDTNHAERLPYGIGPKTLEIGMTAALFAINIAVIATLLFSWIWRLSFEKLHATRRKIAAAEGVAAKVQRGEVEMRVQEAASELYGERRMGAASELFPQRVNPLAASSGLSQSSPRATVLEFEEENAPLKDERSTMLPQGWAAHQTETGKVYYGNARTGESSWLMPVPVQAQSSRSSSTTIARDVAAECTI